MFTRAQARDAGYSRAAISARLEAGEWRRLLRGVFADAGVPVTPVRRTCAVLLSSPAGSVASHTTAAAALWRLEGVVADGDVHVTVPRAATVKPRNGVIVHRGAVLPNERDLPFGVPATTVVRTVLDLARTLTVEASVVAVDSALRAGHCRLDQLAAGLSSAAGLPGVIEARRAVSLADPSSGSPGETRLRLVLVLAGLPAPQSQLVVRDGHGRFLARADLGYREARLLLEYDGYDAHSPRPVFRDDRRRQNALVSNGWLVLRYTASDLWDRRAAIVTEVARLLRERSDAATSLALAR